MKRLSCFVLLFIIFVITHHIMIYIHEWVHGFVAWIAGYKSSPFDIYYGVEWYTLWDINEDIDYSKIYSDGKSYIVAWIAIAPTLVQMILFPIALKILNTSKIKKNWWLFAFFYFLALNFLGEIYAYSPIRAFSGREDMFNFITASGVSPWLVVIIGAVYVILGMYEILAKQILQAYSTLKITTKVGRFTFKLATIAIIFFYYGASGFRKPDFIPLLLGWISWGIFLLCIVYLWIQMKKKIK